MISCHQHDYIEIACLYHFAIKLTLKNGDVLAGTAIDTRYNSINDECIKLNINGKVTFIELERLVSMAAITNNPHFKLVHFD